MVITDVNQVVYQGDGITTAWPYTFVITEPTDIQVMIVDSDGTGTVLDSDYFVDYVNSTVYYPGYAPGAEPVDQPPVLPADKKIIIYRNVPITQTSDLGEKWPFAVIEKMVDKVTMILQDIYGSVARCLKVSIPTENFDATITPVAGKILHIKSDGTGFDCVDAPNEVLDQCVTIYNNTVIKAGEAYASATSAESAATTAEDSAERAVAAAGVASSAEETATNAVVTMRSYFDGAEQDLAKVEGYISAAKDVGLWDALTTYHAGDAVMVENGDVYRCLQDNTNQNPETSPLYWALTQTIHLRTFELDINGDLMPLIQPTTSTNWDIDANGDIEPAE